MTGHDDLDAFVEANTAKRIAAGKAAKITDEAVYRVLDGLFAGRRNHDDQEEAASEIPNNS